MGGAAGQIRASSSGRPRKAKGPGINFSARRRRQPKIGRHVKPPKSVNRTHASISQDCCRYFCALVHIIVARLDAQRGINEAIGINSPSGSTLKVDKRVFPGRQRDGRSHGPSPATHTTTSAHLAASPSPVATTSSKRARQCCSPSWTTTASTRIPSRQDEQSSSAGWARSARWR